ncbi:MAG: hypothetical protein ACREMH_10910 [Gemmatimonadales bacterium]
MRAAGGLAALALALASLVGAQGAVAQVSPGSGGAGAGATNWTLENVADGVCVSFLVTPEVAAELLEGKAAAVSASQAKHLHPAVAQLAAAEPEYASWIPAELCLIEAPRLTAGTRVFAEPGRRLLLGWVALAAGTEGTTMRAVQVFSPNGNLRQFASDILIQVEDVDYSRNMESTGERERRIIKLDGARLIWDGHFGDATSKPAPASRTMSVAGRRNTEWFLSTALDPQWERAALGILRVEGKSRLARGLIGSPLRMVGPAFGGGSLTLDFRRR